MSDASLYFKTAPPLDPAWLDHEQKAGLLLPKPVYASVKERQPIYSQQCKDLNASMLAGRDAHLAEGINVLDSTVTGSDGFEIPIRTYTRSNYKNQNSPEDLAIYYHGGGLAVGDVDSEDLSCRRICIEASIKVISVGYRLLPDNSPSVIVTDAFDAFLAIVGGQSIGKLVVIGSSSGGQLACQVSQLARERKPHEGKAIDGLLVRCPVTCNPDSLPSKFRQFHTSYSASFSTSLAGYDPNSPLNRGSNLPLDAVDFHGLPRTFFQECSNDIYYSDGMCYAKALQDAGVDVKIDLILGWPHTFWLKAPQLDRALKAELDMIKGMKWLLNSS